MDVIKAISIYTNSLTRGRKMKNKYFKNRMKRTEYEKFLEYARLADALHACITGEGEKHEKNNCKL